MAEDGLTSNRAAACRIELPSATARTIRARRSCDKGSAMAEPLALAPDTVNQTNRFSATPNCSSQPSNELPPPHEHLPHERTLLSTAVKHERACSAIGSHFSFR